jgi:quinol monooxygenase YgiN
MQYTRVAAITAKPGQLRDFLRTLEEELLPAYRALPGFVAYTVAKTGESTGIAFGIWETREQAEESIKTSDRWMKEGSGRMLDSLHNNAGDLKFIALTDDLHAYASPAAPLGMHA